MGIFDRFQDPPDVDKLKAKRDVKGLLLALKYGDRRKRKADEDFEKVAADVAQVELAAAQALAEFGETVAIPQFVDRILKDHGGLCYINTSYAKNPWNSYSLILARFGEPAVEALLNMLKAQNPNCVCLAEFALGHIGAAAAKAVPHLLAIARDIKEHAGDTNANAIWALGRITNSPEVVPVLIDAVTHWSGSDVGRRAVQTLGSGRYGKVAADALAGVLEGREDVLKFSVSEAAMLALCLMGDRRGMEAFLLPSNYSRGSEGRWLGEKEILAAVGRFDDERVRQQLRKEMNANIAEMKEIHDIAGLVALDRAVHAALGLAEHQELSAAFFLLESLAIRDLTMFRNWVLEEDDGTLALRALEKLGGVACEAMKELRARQGDAWVEKWLAESSGLGKIELVQLLLKCGVSPDSRYTDGAPALAMAALNGQLESVRILVEAGSKVDLADPGGFTPLICACGRGHLEIVRFLLSAGANPEARDMDGWTALKVASTKGHTGVVEFLRRAGVRE